MKKLTTILILLLLLNLVQAVNFPHSRILYQDELEQVSEQEITNYLYDNLQFVRKFETNEKIYYYYKTKSIEPLPNNKYVLRDLDIQTSIPKNIMDSCIEQNSENYCENLLVESKESNQLTTKPIKVQVEDELKNKLEKIKQNKNLEGDFPTRPEEIVEEIIAEEEIISYPEFTSFEEMLLSLISYDSTTGTYKIGAISLNPDGSILVQNDLTVLGNIYSNQTIENTSVENNPTEIQLPQTYLLEDQDIILNLSE